MLPEQVLTTELVQKIVDMLAEPIYTEPLKSSGLESFPTRFLRTESGARAVFPLSYPENGMRYLDPEKY